MESREKASISEMVNSIELQRSKPGEEKIVSLHSNLALPSYVHGYSLAIEYMYNWFEKRFEKDYFKGGIYVDGKHVLDDYKQFSKSIIKKENPRARIIPTLEHDFDRDGIDSYLAPPDLYLRKSNLRSSFFKDYDKNMFLGITLRALRMNFNFKVRVNTRSQQLDIANRMEMYFRIGATQQDNLNVDFHVPKSIMLNIADRAGFEIANGEIKDIISFLDYLNAHSDLPFLFKIRAINQKAEFFIRMRNLYTHISCKDKLQLDDGERDGKLDFNFHVEMNATLTMLVPHFYSFYSAEDLTVKINLRESSDTVAIYSIQPFEIPKTDENGWMQGAVTEWRTDEGDTEMDLSPIFTGDNPLARAIRHNLTQSVSPFKFINIKVYKNDGMYLLPITMDWKTKIATFSNGPEPEEVLQIAMYYDREYINELDIELRKYNSNRVSNKN